MLGRKRNWAPLALMALTEAGGAWAADLTPPLEKHTAQCQSREICLMKKPAGVGGWELLSKDVVLEEKGEGLWLANFAKMTAGKPLLRVLAADGRVLEIRPVFGSGKK